MTAITLTILGEPASKANSRTIATHTYRAADGGIATRPRVIKSPKALAFVASALKQIPPHCRVRLTGPVRVTLHLYYASERPDLSEELLLDVLQDRWKVVTVGQVKARVLVQAGVYRNDRQVREKHVMHHIDRLNPRAEICVEPLNDAPCALLAKRGVHHEFETAGKPHLALRPHPRPRAA
ncbi:hypothetical protein [Burkholderia diffusa]|uniref:hypothetical protein n=1 Tax=Burkholderia diffusa TaxID=488732 RepID=UPI000A9F3B1F|nr:hypothetical protein [Burkholderia diffusa]